MEQNSQDNNNFLDENNKEKIYQRKRVHFRSSSESGTNEINTAFEFQEQKANCCNCKSCIIFWLIFLSFIYLDD